MAVLHGEAVGYGGWYEVGGIARFRRLGLLPEYRGQGIGTAMIRYVQAHPKVRELDGLVIMAGQGGRQERLYKELGFARAGIYWTIEQFK